MNSCTEPAAKRHVDKDNAFEEAEQSYFKSYSDLYVHEEMLRDTERTFSYRKAILTNKDLIQGKVVADVGAGTGILSCFCALAGAKKVYAIEASPVANLARRIVSSNKMDDCITVIQEKVEKCELPEKVDIIVSEWMGYCLMYESMLTSVLYARDRWLKPDGVMFPKSAAIFAAPVNVERFWEDRVNSWANMKDLYGVDMSCLRGTVETTTLKSVQVVPLHGEDVLANAECVISLNLSKVTAEDLNRLEGVFHFQCHGSAAAHGVGLWFVVTFPGKPPVLLSTSPYMPSTHWNQCVLFFDSPVDVEQDDKISGTILMTPAGLHKRFLDVRLTCQVNEKGGIEKVWRLDDQTC